MELTTESGLTVVARSQASLGGLFGSGVSPMPPVPGVQPWAGWPTEAGWAPPLWNQQTGLGLFGQYVSTVYTCADLNSRELATFPIYRMRGTQHLPDVPWMGDPEPALYADWSEFAKQLVNCMMLRGEAIIYALARYLSDDTVARMVVLNPDAVEIDWDGEVTYTVGTKRLDPRDVCHIKYQSWPGNLRGISPLSWVGRNLVAADAMERYQAELAANGGIPWGVLTAPGNLSAEQAESNRVRWIEASARRGSAPVMLSGGLSLDTLTISPKDMALLDLRVFDEQRICAAMGVPPYLVGLPQAEGLTYANATSLFDYHWRATLRPLSRSIATALSRWSLPAGQRVEFNADEYVRPSLGERASVYSTLFAIVDPVTGQRAITVDEIRQAERLDPYDPLPTGMAGLTGPSEGRFAA